LTELAAPHLEAADIHLTVVLWLEVAKPASLPIREMIEPLIFPSMEKGEYK
jgi:hypothetical protein